jgi:hypothetical protein
MSQKLFVEDILESECCDEATIKDAARELRKMRARLKKATELARIRRQQITQLETAVRNMHAARMPYAMQSAWAELLVLCGLPQKEQK